MRGVAALRPLLFFGLVCALRAGRERQVPGVKAAVHGAAKRLPACQHSARRCRALSLDWCGSDSRESVQRTARNTAAGKLFYSLVFFCARYVFGASARPREVPAFYFI
jgi:hypothetical protein